MPIMSTNSINSYTGDGVNKIFPYTFKLFNAQDLFITINAESVESGFTVSGVGQSMGGNITFNIAPAVGSTVVLKRKTNTIRTTDYLPAGPLNADTLDTDLDRVVAMIQDLNRDVSIGWGSVLTDDLKIHKPVDNVSLTLNSTIPTQRSFYFSTNDLARWAITTNFNAETGDNEGSDFIVSRYADDGYIIPGHPIQIKRADGKLILNGDPVEPFHATTKHYVDSQILNIDTDTGIEPGSYNVVVVNSKGKVVGGGNQELYNQNEIDSMFAAVESELENKSDTTHEHDSIYEPIIPTKNTAFNKNFGTTANTVCEGDDSRLSDSRTPVYHEHSIEEITDLDDALNSKAEQNNVYTKTEVDTIVSNIDIPMQWGYLTGDLSDQIDLLNELSGKSNVGHNHNSQYSPLSHRHDLLYAPVIHDHATVYAEVGHTHNDSYPGISTVYTKTEIDNMIEVPTWGNIVGVLHEQTDLQGVLDTKAPNMHGHLIEEILDLTIILNSKASSTHTHTIANITGLSTALDGKASSTHDHTIANITGLSTALDGKASSTHNHDSAYAAISSVYTKSEVDDIVGDIESTLDAILGV